MQSTETIQAVQDYYGGLAERGSTDRSEGYQTSVAKAFGYDPEDLKSLPENANLGVSCGNPLALASLREGETVIDLGSGGGIDVILAARKVGPKGKAIGVDMTKKMLALAHENVEKAGITNASFVEGFITAIPLEDSTADCIISNCVVNLVPKEQKSLVFHEMFRLLKPGGRVAISDILARRELPPEIANDLALYVGCIAGASQAQQYHAYLKDAGFDDIMIVDTKADLNVYKEMPQEKSACCGMSCSNLQINDKIRDYDCNEWAGSFQIYAVKPAL
ncbi:putative ubiE/COQ5 methyltransferase [Aspergillus fischeri NRRL 181]|uniref:Arsenite methyltransferase n=1 Tax=Neosartorya fischeri (strain ATCC 1020 / DSM 3700 / CBS 544.65 / FGSC A1164 / JCM 1740 / NRRL 181 / WB 181) TaxID=331117 RepID=A1DJW1_NEOFI|nr:UbiE/COQ5 family methyltransferase, putative [Aspergillus fischeri NRRL 181]EAW17000.1 UbiE/COQ5 family methyltransferase, putative [Aspergillus fischeri NRRL 181]